MSVGALPVREAWWKMQPAEMQRSLPKAKRTEFKTGTFTDLRIWQYIADSMHYAPTYLDTSQQPSPKNNSLAQLLVSLTLSSLLRLSTLPFPLIQVCTQRILQLRHVTSPFSKYFAILPGHVCIATSFYPPYQKNMQFPAQKSKTVAFR